MTQLVTQLEGIAAAQRAKAKELKKINASTRHRLVAVFETRELAQRVFDTATCLGTPCDKINMIHFSNRRDRELVAKLKELVYFIS